jgi:hypothetical protein
MCLTYGHLSHKLNKMSEKTMGHRQDMAVKVKLIGVQYRMSLTPGKVVPVLKHHVVKVGGRVELKLHTLLTSGWISSLVQSTEVFGFLV